METNKDKGDKVLMLSQHEWNFKESLESVPEWQLIAMLNYEYARCYEPLLKEVEKLRLGVLPVWNLADRKPEARYKRKGNILTAIPRGLLKNPLFDFTYYLASVFPEFPLTPWVKIPHAIREKRLADVNISENIGLHSIPGGPAWKTWEIQGQEVAETEGESSQKMWENWVSLLPSSRGVFEINFKHNDEEIIAKFSEWLQQHRKKLIVQSDCPLEAFTRQGVSIGVVGNFSAAFCPSKKPEPEWGRGNKKVLCKDLLKYLGWMRIWCLAEWDLNKAVELPWPDPTMQGKSKKSSSEKGNNQEPHDFFSDSQNIKRAELRVSETLRDFKYDWYAGPHFSFCADPASSPSGQAAKDSREFLKSVFTIEAMKTEPAQKKVYTPRSILRSLQRKQNESLEE